MQNVSNLQIPEGAVRTIHDKDGKLLWGRLAYDTNYAGDTLQNGTPTPDTPIPVQVVTGTQTVQITAGTESEDFTVDLGTIELCKIGTYQDYIYKSGDDWYVHKECGNRQLTTVSGTYSSAGSGYIGAYYNNAGMLPNSRTNGFSNRFSAQFSPVGSTTEAITYGTTGSNQIFIILNSSRMASSTVANWESWLANNETVVYYPLAAPTDTKITDSMLIGQLNAVYQWLTRYGYNATVSGNLPIVIDRTNL